MCKQPSNEEFDAMNDAAFCDHWDAWFAKVQAAASSEEEVADADAEMKAAFDRRWS